MRLALGLRDSHRSFKRVANPGSACIIILRPTASTHEMSAIDQASQKGARQHAHRPSNKLDSTSKARHHACGQGGCACDRVRWGPRQAALRPPVLKRLWMLRAQIQHLKYPYKLVPELPVSYLESVSLQALTLNMMKA